MCSTGSSAYGAPMYSIRQHTSAYVSIRFGNLDVLYRVLRIRCGAPMNEQPLTTKKNYKKNEQAANRPSKCVRIPL